MIVRDIKLFKCLEKIDNFSLIVMKKWTRYYRIELQCFTQMTNTFVLKFILLEIELCECLERTEDLSLMAMKKWTKRCHCVVLQCFTQMTSTFHSNFIPRKIELCKRLEKKENLRTRWRWWTEQNITVLCCSIPLRWRAPSSPISFLLRSSCSSVYRKCTSVVISVSAHFLSTHTDSKI